jgi:glycosyltransferase involved in cell wall biosynthesis
VESPPTVTVVLPAYNAEKWIERAVASVLGQSLRDFDLIVVDDGSTDNTARCLARQEDARLRIIRHEVNRGLVDSLNEGIEESRGKYIARMDADDFAHPRRLELQVRLLERDLSIGVCGTWFWNVSTKTSTVRTPTRHDHIAAHLFFRSPIAHPTVMMRRSFIQASGLRYRSSALHAEDFDLWVRARSMTRFGTVPKYLLEYRSHENQVSWREGEKQNASASKIRLQQLDSMYPDASPEERTLHLRLCEAAPFSSVSELAMARQWLDQLERANMERRMFPSWAFREALADIWFSCCVRSSAPPARLVPLYLTRRRWSHRVGRVREDAVLAYRALRGTLAH